MKPWQGPLDPLFDGWWIAESGPRDERYCNTVNVRQIHAGDAWDITTMRGPFPTQEEAREFQYRDDVETYWEAGLAIYADRCLSCGRYAKVIAFSNYPGFAWRVTECKKCGVLDSRPKEDA